MPTISVIVPVYMVEKYLHRCIDSILAQSFPDFELILVDDGSPDGCGAICDEYAQKDSRVIVIHQKNGGLSAARNAGINWAFANSDSRWLTFVDSDDWIHPRMLEVLLEAANTQQLKISVCGYQEVRQQEPYEEIRETVYKKAIPNDFYVANEANGVVAWGKLYQKSCFEKLRYPVGKIHEDEFVTYRILYAQPYIAYIQEKLYFYFENAQGITKRKWHPARLDVLDAFKKQAHYFKKIGMDAAKRRSIYLYKDSLLTQYAQFKQVYTPSKPLERRFRLYARYYLAHFWKADSDMEGNVRLLKLAFPNAAKTYHWIKRQGLQKRK